MGRRFSIAVGLCWTWPMAVHESLRTAEPAARALPYTSLRASRRTRWIAYGGVAGLLGVAAWYGAGWFGPKKKGPPPPPVRVAVAQRRDMTVTQNTIGTVVSPA